MQKQLIHIHGGESFEDYDAYLAFLQEYEIEYPPQGKEQKWKERYKEFLGDDWDIVMPNMPSPRNAKYIEWELWMQKYVPFLCDGVVLVGHSLGAIFLAEFLQKNTLPISIAQLHLISGPAPRYGDFTFTVLDNITQQCGEVYIYHSEDDFVVPYAEGKELAQHLPCATLVTFSDRGHFLQEEFPELIKNVLMS